MNKKDLIRSIAESTQVSRTTAERGLNGLLAALESAMKEGQRVTVVGFGSFSVVERAPRTGRNPKTGEMVPIPSRRVVRFRAGKELAGKIE